MQTQITAQIETLVNNAGYNLVNNKRNNIGTFAIVHKNTLQQVAELDYSFYKGHVVLTPKYANKWRAQLTIHYSNATFLKEILNVVSTMLDNCPRVEATSVKNVTFKCVQRELELYIGDQLVVTQLLSEDPSNEEEELAICKVELLTGLLEDMLNN